MYYKLKAFHDAGWDISLHTYSYKGRERVAPPFFTENDRVFFYRRHMGWRLNMSPVPYIVNSRRDDSLLDNLLADSSPILFEGLHTTSLLDNQLLRSRIKIVRTHNVEHDYYAGLAAAEKSILKKSYYSIESLRLKKYEKILAHADIVAAISSGDKDYFEKKFPDNRVMLLPCFYDDSEPEVLPGSGDYVLYQGNLSVPENEQAAMRICRDIAPRIGKIKFIIAGAGPSLRLRNMVEATQNVRLMENLPAAEFNKVLTDARVNLLITEQATGVKLKLLNAMCRGAHIVANSKMMESTGLRDYVEVADSAGDICRAIEKKMGEPFTNIRRLPDFYNNLHNIRRLESYMEMRQDFPTQ